MTKDTKSDASKSVETPSKAASERELRLADALRQNLRRRKAGGVKTPLAKKPKGASD
ncbi:MAG: hypothetical protein AAGC95_01770 [Pseudomonadota bacterium]